MTKAEEFLAAAKILPVGEAALMVSFGDVIAPELLNCSRALTQALEENPFPGIYEFEASYTGVTIFYNPLVLASQSDLPEDPVLSKGFREAAKWVRNLLDQLVLTTSGETEKVRNSCLLRRGIRAGPGLCGGIPPYDAGRSGENPYQR